LLSARPGTRQRILIFFLFASNFFRSLATVLETKFSNLVYFWCFLLHLINLFHLLEFFRKKQVWTAGA
jgi:hypothetical protein